MDYAPEQFAFDEHHAQVPTVMPDADLGEVCPHCQRPYDTPEGLSAAEQARIRQEAIRETLAFLAGDTASVNRVGWRAVLLAWLVDKRQSQRAIALRFNVTEGRVSQALKSLRREIRSFNGPKTHQGPSGA